MILRDGKFGKVEPMPANAFPAPRILPPARHPRLLVAEGEVAVLREKLNEPVYAAAKAEYERLLSLDLSALMNADAARDGIALGCIEARAFACLVQGNEQAGREAIEAIRTYAGTVSFAGLADDYRFMGQTMFTAAEVYDWCYPLMTDRDKCDFAAIVENILAPRMEIGMPPCRYGVLAGHQAEAQLLRDWLSFAVACYDEYPDIYGFVAGRFFERYVPVRNYWYRSGSPINGSSYGGYRFTWDVWSAWIFEKMCGERVYGEEMETLPAQWLHFRRPDGQGLRDGDDYNEFGGRWNQYGYPWFYAGNLFGNPVYRKQAFLKLGNRDSFTYTELTLTPVQMLLFDRESVGTADFEDDYPLVVHYPDPCGVTLARTGYDISPDSRDVLALMKIGGLWTANHHHMDFGHFQLYYRGILASDSGAYIRYGSPQDMSYNKQTVAHNCVLIYKEGETNGRAINSGGQLMGPGEVLDLNHWLSDPRYRMARVLGHDENPAFTSISGDLTAAYGEKAKLVLRRMAFLPRIGEEIPALMFVYDRVISADASYPKTSLLHCQEEPEISGNRAVIRRTAAPRDFAGFATQYNGKLVSQHLLPKNARLCAIGGEGRQFTVNGVNYPYDYAGKLKDCTETGWGRVEISPPSPACEDEFLNVMYVTDGDADLRAEATLAECGAFAGAVILSEAVFFSREKTFRGSVTLTVPEAVAQWHLVGLAGGVWSVWDGERLISRQYVSAGSGVLQVASNQRQLTFVHSRNEYEAAHPGHRGAEK